MVTINDNRSYSCKKFEDIPEYEYFICNAQNGLENAGAFSPQEKWGKLLMSPGF